MSSTLSRTVYTASMATLLLFLVSCASRFNPLSVSESQLEGYLKEQIVKFDKDQMAAGSPLQLTLRDAEVRVGPDGRDVIEMMIEGAVTVDVLLARVPVDIALKVEGSPFFDASERAVYIRRLSLLDSKVESSLFKYDFKPVTENLMRLVARMLETRPVYRFSESDLASTLLNWTDMDLKVGEGRLMLVPGSSARET